MGLGWIGWKIREHTTYTIHVYIQWNIFNVIRLFWTFEILRIGVREVGGIWSSRSRIEGGGFLILR